MEISVMMVESVINKGKMIVLWALTSLAFCNKTHWFEKKSICWPELPDFVQMANPEVTKLLAKITNA